MSIQKDLRIGEQGEQSVISLFANADMVSVQTAGKFSDYDIETKLGKTKFTSEIKNDVYSCKSGNIAIEMFNPKSNKASGLMATKADLWIHISEGIYMTSVQQLKQFVKDKKPFKVIDNGGDDNATLFLYKKEHIFDAIFVQINTLDKKALRQTIRGIIKCIQST